MRLINALGQEIEKGARLRAIAGKEIGQVWHFSHVLEHPTDGHRVHVTRRHPRMGHLHKEFHPSVFGLSVVVDVTWRKHVRNSAYHAWQKFDEYLIAGAVALLPLAFFEKYHLAERLPEIFGH